MRVQVSTSFACLLVLSLFAGSQQQGQKIPDVLLKLREPLTAISLKNLFDNMANMNTVTFYTKCVIGQVQCDRVGAALRHLLTDHIPGRNLCHGCTECERERVQYVIDTMKADYPKHACAVEKSLKKNIFGGAAGLKCE